MELKQEEQNFLKTLDGQFEHAETLKLEIGESFVGYFVGIKEMETALGKQRVMNLRDSKGVLWGIWLGKGLAALVAFNNPVRGEMVGLKRLPDFDTGKKGFKPAKSYLFRVNRELVNALD
jgi:hypothetical protein